MIQWEEQNEEKLVEKKGGRGKEEGKKRERKKAVFLGSRELDSNFITNILFWANHSLFIVVKKYITYDISSNKQCIVWYC